MDGRDCCKEPRWEVSSGIETGGKGDLHCSGAGAFTNGARHQLEKQMEGQALGRGGEKAGKDLLASSRALYSHQISPRAKRA